MDKIAPIGVFDSGYGGLTVLRELHAYLPEYDYLYLGDNARAPYGTRSFDVVYAYTWQCVKELFNRGCDLVILACNTASAKALRSIQQNELLDYPGKRVLGVIRPSAEVIGAFSNSGQIGVLATEGTVKSESYRLEIKKCYPNVTIFQQACPLWVPLVENMEFTTPEGKTFVQRDVQHFLSKHPEVDVIMLGCTHYPLLIPIILEVLPANVKLVSQGEIVAQSLTDYLKRHSWLKNKISTHGTTQYLTSENAKSFENSVKNILGVNIEAQHIQIK